MLNESISSAAISTYAYSVDWCLPGWQNAVGNSSLSLAYDLNEDKTDMPNKMVHEITKTLIFIVCNDKPNLVRWNYIEIMPKVPFWDLENRNITTGYSLISITNVKQMKGLEILGDSTVNVVQQYEIPPASFSSMF